MKLKPARPAPPRQASAQPRRLYLAAYDVCSPRRLRHALKAVKPYASGGQKSAHECWLTPTDARALMDQARELLDAEDDAFALIPIDPRRPVYTLGTAVEPSSPEFFYFG